MIDVDITLLIQLVNFFITLVVLHYVLITPVREQLKKRRATVDGLSEEIGEFLNKADEQFASYEYALRGARERAALLRTEARENAEEIGLEILGQAGKDAQATMHAAQTALRDEVQKTRNILNKDMQAYTNAAIDKLLG